MLNFGKIYQNNQNQLKMLNKRMKIKNYFIMIMKINHKMNLKVMKLKIIIFDFFFSNF